MFGLRTAAAAITIAALPVTAMAEGVVGTVDGELPFDGLYVNDVAALNVSAFRATMTVDFRKVERIEFVDIDPETQVATVRITFLDSYVMPATFSVPENSPWIAIGAYGRANYSAENLMNGDVQYVQFIHDGTTDESATDIEEPEEEPEADTGN